MAWAAINRLLAIVQRFVVGADKDVNEWRIGIGCNRGFSISQKRPACPPRQDQDRADGVKNGEIVEGEINVVPGSLQRKLEGWQRIGGAPKYVKATGAA